MSLKLWHCAGSRSVRPLWTMEEMGLDYELEVMQFPPRFLHPGYAEINPIGTVPYFVDDKGGPDNIIRMTESAGISQYLVDRYGPSTLGVEPSEVGYGGYLNWIHRSDATLTFPQTLVLRYTLLEPEAYRKPSIAPPVPVIIVCVKHDVVRPVKRQGANTSVWSIFNDPSSIYFSSKA